MAADASDVPAAPKPAEDKSAEDVLNEMQESQAALGRRQIIVDYVHQLTLSDEVVPNKGELRDLLLSAIDELEMAPYYEHVCERVGWEIDQQRLGRLRKANEDKLKSLDDSIEDARENYGDTEVFERMCEKAQYYVQIGDRTLALETYDSIPTKLSSSGQKVDIAMHKALMGFMFGDVKLVQHQIELAKELNEKGGDWDRRNRLRVYEGMHFIMVRDFDRAAERLMDGIATYTAYEMFGYERFAFYTVLMAMHSLSRIDLKKKVVESPDILAVLREIPHLEDFLTGYYNGRYTTFFQALVDLHPYVLRDRFLYLHAGFLVRELRVRAYVQFLASYKSVTMEGMARQFGVSVPFLDRELSRFIAAQRLNAKIDKLRGIIETTRPDRKNAQYHAIMRNGDALLNRIQRFSRMISV